ncbi:MAG: VWA domain-containing protein [Planctomycetota bacterium]
MPVLGLPLALIGLLALPALAGIYVLRTRYRRRTVSTLLLWHAVAQATGGGRKANRMQTPWVFVLELLALLLLILAAAAPRFLASGQRAAVIVVLDDSWSMQAMIEGQRTARDAGVDAVIDELAGLGRYSAGFILAGEEPVRLSESARNAAEVRNVLKAWRATSVTSDLPAAIAWARQTGGVGARVLVISDRMPKERWQPDEDREANDSSMPGDVVWPAPPFAVQDNTDVRWCAVGEANDNAGVIRALRSMGNDGREVIMVEVGRYGQGSGEREVRVRLDLWKGSPQGTTAWATRTLRPADWTTLHRTSVSLAAGQTQRFWFEPPAAMQKGGLLRVTASMAGDVLSADDVAWLADQPKPPVKVATRIADEDLRRSVVAALSATGSAELVDDAQTSELVLSTRPVLSAGTGPPLLSGNPSAPWDLVLLTPDESLESRPFLGPFLLNGRHRLMHGVSLSGVVWSASPGSAVEAAFAGADVIASAGDVPLIAVRGGGRGSRTVLVNFDPKRSTVLQTVAWPVLVSNVVNARLEARPGLSVVNTNVGVAVELSLANDPSAPLSADAEHEEPIIARVQRLRDLGDVAIEASPAEITMRDGQASWVPAHPGVYAIEFPDAEPRFVSVAGGSSSESDLRNASHGEVGGLNAQVMSRPEYRSFGWLFGLAVLGLIALEACVLRGGIPTLGKRSGTTASELAGVAI